MRNNLRSIILLAVAGALLGTVSAQNSTQTPPKVEALAIPDYPMSVRLAHIQGLVHLKVTTDGRSVSNIEIEDGPPLLGDLAERNVRTWRLTAHDPTSFIVSYEYVLIDRSVQDTTVTLELPSSVKVVAVRQDSVKSPSSKATEPKG